MTMPLLPKAVPGWMPAERPLPAHAKPIPLIDLTPRQCRWPHGPTNGPQTMFCGAPKAADSSYCKHHRRVSRGEA